MSSPNPVPSSAMPNRKVVVGVAAGAAMTIVAWASKAFAEVEIPAEVALAGSTIIVFVIQYLVPNAEV
jgi:hypothetical protein